MLTSKAKKYLRYLILPFIAFATPKIDAQNLVLNPGFEDYDSCTSGISTFHYPYINFWISPNIGTPDLFNNCSADILSRPNTAAFGPQSPHGGAGYAGCHLYILQTDENESIEATLTQSLQKDSFYCVKFYVSLSEEYSRPIDRIGCYFSNNQITNTPFILPYAPQIESPEWQYYSDTKNWMPVQGIYQAKGGEQYLTIANFNGSNTHVDPNTTPSYHLPYTYYYIDDVSVELIPAAYGNLHIGNDTLICDTIGFSYPLNVSAIYDSVKWNTGETTFSITITHFGAYIATAFIGGCTVTDTVTFTYYNQVPVTPLHDTATCAVNAPLVIKATDGFDHYTWSNDDTTAITTIYQGGIYYVSATNVCNIYIDSVLVTLYPTPPPPVVTDTAVCRQIGTITLQATGTNLLWYATPDGTVPLGTTPTVSLNEPGTKNYYVSQTINTCQSNTAKTTLTVNIPPATNLGADQLHCKGSDLILHAGDNLNHYLWSSGDTTSQISVSTTGTYSCTVSNSCGTAIDDVAIEIVKCDNCLFAPNAFSPNGDGYNDIYLTYTTCNIKYYRLQIFNRIGEKVFDTNNPNDGWDGTYKATLQPPNVYVYQLTIVNAVNETINSKGSITLLR